MHAWKIKQSPYLQYKTKGEITASLKSEMGEGLLYQQLLPTLKRGFKVALSKHALAI